MVKAMILLLQPVENGLAVVGLDDALNITLSTYYPFETRVLQHGEILSQKDLTFAVKELRDQYGVEEIVFVLPSELVELHLLTKSEGSGDIDKTIEQKYGVSDKDAYISVGNKGSLVQTVYIAKKSEVGIFESTLEGSELGISRFLLPLKSIENILTNGIKRLHTFILLMENNIQFEIYVFYNTNLFLYKTSIIGRLQEETPALKAYLEKITGMKYDTLPIVGVHDQSVNLKGILSKKGFTYVDGSDQLTIPFKSTEERVGLQSASAYMRNSNRQNLLRGKNYEAGEKNTKSVGVPTQSNHEAQEKEESIKVESKLQNESLLVKLQERISTGIDALRPIPDSRGQQNDGNYDHLGANVATHYPPVKAEEKNKPPAIMQSSLEKEEPPKTKTEPIPPQKPEPKSRPNVSLFVKVISYLFLVMIIILGLWWGYTKRDSISSLFSSSQRKMVEYTYSIQVEKDNLQPIGATIRDEKLELTDNLEVKGFVSENDHSLLYAKLTENPLALLSFKEVDGEYYIPLEPDTFNLDDVIFSHSIGEQAEHLTGTVTISGYYLIVPESSIMEPAKSALEKRLIGSEMVADYAVNIESITVIENSNEYILNIEVIATE